ncbi:MAG: phospholipase D-like domain-containing protein [Treponema sp.]|nr:phospholipase D-like domain-containing protein [Treponema sp.]
MYLTSTKLLEDKNGKKFSWSDIFVNVGKIIEMTVVSAFVDDDTLHSLIEELQKESGKASMRDSVRLKIFIDAAASRFAQKESQEKFLALNKIIEDACWNSEQRTRKIFTDDSGIHLVSIRNTRLFHSKMILCKSTTKMRMILGSVNFTKCAFNNNEELAIVGDVDITDGVVTNAKKNDLFRQALEYEKILNDSLENDKNHDNEYSVKKGKKSGVRVRRISKELANSYTPIDDDLYAYLMRGSLFYSKPVCFSEYFPLNLPKGLLQKKWKRTKLSSHFLEKVIRKKVFP